MLRLWIRQFTAAPPATSARLGSSVMLGPGGLVLIQDEQGFHHVREAPNDEALAIQWQSIQAEYRTFYDQRDAYELATEEAGPSESGYAPRIWVGSLADYNNGRLHGVWMDATLEPGELEAAAQFMLRNGYRKVVAGGMLLRIYVMRTEELHRHDMRRLIGLGTNTSGKGTRVSLVGKARAALGLHRPSTARLPCPS